MSLKIIPFYNNLFLQLKSFTYLFNEIFMSNQAISRQMEAFFIKGRSLR
jgi:hypothetical protein